MFLLSCRLTNSCLKKLSVAADYFYYYFMETNISLYECIWKSILKDSKVKTIPALHIKSGYTRQSFHTAQVKKLWCIY